MNRFAGAYVSQTLELDPRKTDRHIPSCCMKYAGDYFGLQCSFALAQTLESKFSAASSPLEGVLH